MSNSDAWPNNTPAAPAVDWRDELEYRKQLRAAVLTRVPSAEDARELAEIAFERAAVSCAGSGSLGELGLAVVEGAAMGAAAVLSGMLDGGEVAITWPEGNTRRMPVGANAAGPSLWLRGVSCALMARDADALSVLCEPAHVAAVQLPPHRADPFWPFLCSAVAALVREPSAVGSFLDDARALMEPGRVSCGEPEAIAAQVAPLLPLVEALANGGRGWHGALGRAVEAHRGYFAAHGRPRDPYRLVPLEVLGLAALAFDRHKLEAPELPVEPVHGNIPRRLLTVCVAYSPRLATHLDDPSGFLDLEGFPRSERDHVVIQRDEKAIARYRLKGRPGVPCATVDFVLSTPDETGAEPGLPRALDAGERVLLADLGAKRAGSALDAGDGKQAAAWLANAIEWLDAVLAAIPSGEHSVPRGEFVNPRGLQLLASEPGRFDRERLAAYRETLVRRRAALLPTRAPGAPLSPTLASEHSVRAVALAWVEVIKERVKPVLIALARDRSGETLAQLRPRPDDYAKAFDPAAADAARRAYEALWQSPADLQLPTGDRSEVRIFAAPAGMLADDNELSRHFPQGYRGIARFLEPRHVWICWKYVRPGETSGLAYDGLVWCDDHWAWFPKPFRSLSQLLR